MKFKKYFSLFLILAMILSAVGCSLSGQKAPTAGSSEFKTFTEDIFMDEVQSDSIMLNYTLSNPEDYGITDYKPTLGECSVQAQKNALAESENYMNRLDTFDYGSLTDDQKLTYDILRDYYSVDKEADDFLLYPEYLGPTSGVQAQLPILLAEYNFIQKSDFYDYLALLKSFPAYFSDIIAFEKEKSANGLFMNDSTMDEIIDQCKNFIKNPEDNYLIGIFNDRVDGFKGLTKAEKRKCREENKKSILELVIPAYENLIKELTALRGTGKNEGGLCNLPEGKQYYEYAVSATTGSGKSIKEMDALLGDTIQNALIEMNTIMDQDDSAFDKAVDAKYPMTDPEAIIEYLRTAITDEFPPLNDIDCTIKYVDKSLEDHLSPAFYLTPPLDHYKQNSIYINGSDKYDLSTIFTTVAHEGYPGHLYQTVYFLKQEPDPIRSVLNFSGYAEGWATYVELYSYSLIGLDKNAAQILRDNTLVTLCMYGKMDIGIHYYGWDKNRTAKYLSSFGIKNQRDVDEVYQTIASEPCNYLKYIIGCLEFMELRKETEDRLKDRFSATAFHDFILKTGPSQFPLLKTRLEEGLK